MLRSQTSVDAQQLRQGSVRHIREYIIMHQSSISIIQHTCKDGGHGETGLRHGIDSVRMHSGEVVR